MAPAAARREGTNSSGLREWTRKKKKKHDRSRGGCAGMFSPLRSASRALARTSRGRRGTMSTPVLTRHRSWSGSPGYPRCWTAGSRSRDARLLPPGLPVVLVSLDSRLLNTHPRTDRAALGYSCRAPQSMLACTQPC